MKRTSSFLVVASQVAPDTDVSTGIATLDTDSDDLATGGVRGRHHLVVVVGLGRRRHLVVAVVVVSLRIPSPNIDNNAGMEHSSG